MFERHLGVGGAAGARGDGVGATRQRSNIRSITYPSLRMLKIACLTGDPSLLTTTAVGFMVLGGIAFKQRW